MILSLDPGTTESGWCMFDEARNAVYNAGVDDNRKLLMFVGTRAGTMPFAIEMVASYGMPVGREVFETCVWIGRFQQSWRDPNAVRLIYRRDVKLHLCGNARAKDANVRQALIDKLGPVGTKGAPGPLYGIKSHAWAALAVAVTALETK